MPLPKLDREQRLLLESAFAACRRAGAIHRQYFRRADLGVEWKRDASPVTPSDRLAEEAIRETLFRATHEFGCFGEEFGQEGDERDRWVIDPLDGTKNFIAGLPHFATLIALERDGRFELGVVHAPLLADPHPDTERDPRDPASLGESWWAIRGVGAYQGPGSGEAALGGRRLEVSRVGRVGEAFITHGGLKRLMKAGLWPKFTLLVERVARTRGFGDWWGHMLVAEGRCEAMVEASVALYDVAAPKVIVEEAGGAFFSRGNAPLDSQFNEAVLASNRTLADPLRELLEF
ncbi:MAG TPA: inositol monophosphatase family protein [Thermoanaerobaculia bacterium]|mgnify:CR=1 FL=1|nr:inositol monophosphatase family protein [Thermoanaerobaculia bacterium]